MTTRAKQKASLLAAIGFALVFCGSRNAHATIPANVEVDAKFGYATKPSAGITALGIGVGGRAGLELLHSFYFGVDAMSYFGSSSEDGQGGNGHAYLLGIDAGYGFHLGLLTLRPQFGIGEATFFQSDVLFGKAPPGSPSDSYVKSGTQTHLYLGPGVTALVTLGVFQVGANVEVILIPGARPTDPTSFSADAGISFVTGIQAGVRF